MTNASSYTPLTAQEAERFIRSVYLARRSGAFVAVTAWTPEGYRRAVEQSSLKSSVKRTLHVMVESASGDQTTIDRATLCLLTGIKVESTITEHFRKARAAGLLESQRRFNSSSIHTLLIPGVAASGNTVQAGRRIKWHCWTDEEIAWWDNLNPDQWTPPPWHPWPGYCPPF